MCKSYQVRSVFLFALLAGISFFLFSQCSSHAPEGRASINKNPIEKQKGAHVFRIKDTSYFHRLKQNNIEWITIVPWGFQKDYKASAVNHYDGDSTQLYDRITLIRDAGFKVFVKPHVWVDTTIEGKWRSEIFPLNEKNWMQWQNSYEKYILHYAKIAEKAGAEMFCVGTEFTRLAIEKPIFWQELIQKLRTIYTGKLTYAANWYKEYEEIPFWDKLDYIGIQAYFPLVDKKHPSLEDLRDGWKKYIPKMVAISKNYNRKILFTEMGYKSTASAAIEPWLWAEHLMDEKLIYSEETQANCYKSFFENLWNKNWFAGVHIWQIRADYSEGTEWIKLDFMPQGNTAEKIITEGFKN